MVFLQVIVQQKHTEVTSFCMQFEKTGCGLLREAFRGRESGLLAEKVGGKEEHHSWKM